MKTSDFTRTVNLEARNRYHELNTITGTASWRTRYLTRLALRADTPYPYSFREDDTFYPQGPSFGRIVRASRSEGLQAIHEEISSKSTEHAWVFVPDVEMWVDHTRGAYDASVDTDRHLEVYLSHMFPKIEPIHTHPDMIVREAAEDLWGELSQNYLLEAATPSGNDLIGAVQMSARSAVGSVIMNGIVSHYGHTAYNRLSPARLDGSFNMTADRKVTTETPDPIITIQETLKTWMDGAVVTTYNPDQSAPAFAYAFEPLAQ